MSLINYDTPEIIEPCTQCGPLGIRPAILPIEDIDFGERERKDYDDGGELLASIRDRGILQSLLVLERPNDKYLLLAGGRRFRCAEQLLLPEVPCLITAKPLTFVEIKTIEMVENLHRKDLSYDEEVSMKAKLHQLMCVQHGKRDAGSRPDDPGWNLEKTAQLLGKGKGGREQLRKDIELAVAIEALPELGKYKNKTEANKVLSTIVREHNIMEKCKEVEAKLVDGPKQHLVNSFVVGDFFEQSGKLPAGGFDFVELDPDYGMGLLDLHESRNGPLMHTKENYHEWEPKVYEENLRRTLAESYRLLKEGGWIICWFAFEPHFETTFQALIQTGFAASRVPALWTKPSAHALNPSMLLASGYDGFFYARKGSSTLAKPGTSNLFPCNLVPPTRRIHPTEKPVELYEKIISTFVEPGARMLVPMCGSGNQLLAAANLKVQGIGFDLGKAYKDGFTVRVFEGIYGQYRSFPT